MKKTCTKSTNVEIKNCVTNVLQTRKKFRTAKGEINLTSLIDNPTKIINQIILVNIKNQNKHGIQIYSNNDKMLLDLNHVCELMKIPQTKITEKYKKNAVEYENKLLVDISIICSLITLRKNKTNESLMNEIKILIESCQKINENKVDTQNETLSTVRNDCESSDYGSSDNEESDNEFSNNEESDNKLINVIEGRESEVNKINVVKKVENYIVVLNENNKEEFVLQEKVEESKIKKYNKYNEKYPMKYVSRCVVKKTEKWKFRIHATKIKNGIEKTFDLKNKKNVIDTAVQYLIKNRPDSIIKLNQAACAKIHYNNKIIFLYDYKNEFYVDLNLAINNIELNQPKVNILNIKSI